MKRTRMSDDPTNHMEGLWVDENVPRHGPYPFDKPSDDAALFRPFAAMWKQAHDIEAKAALFMRAAMQVRDRADIDDLRALADRCMEEGARIRGQVPRPEREALEYGGKHRRRR